jgi:hypothetical protein
LDIFGNKPHGLHSPIDLLGFAQHEPDDGPLLLRVVLGADPPLERLIFEHKRRIVGEGSAINQLMHASTEMRVVEHHAPGRKRARYCARRGNG